MKDNKDPSDKYVGLFILALSFIFTLINLVAWIVHQQIFLIFVFVSMGLLVLGTRILISGKLPSFMAIKNSARQ